MIVKLERGGWGLFCTVVEFWGNTGGEVVDSFKSLFLVDLCEFVGPLKYEMIVNNQW